MAGITHTKVSIIADDPNYDIQPGDWNAEHTIAATVPNVATTATSDMLFGAAGAWVKKTLAEAQAIMLAYGWVTVADTWTYASATTITVPSGAAAIYSVGDNIKLTQTTVKYFYVVTVADTLLTVAGGSDYAVADEAITLPYYSKAASPVGFPQWFNLTSPVWTTSATAFSNQPSPVYAQFNITRRLLCVDLRGQCHATSGGTGIFIATFTTGEMPALSSVGRGGSAICNSDGYSGPAYSTGALVIKISKYDLTALATNSQYFGFKLFQNI